ncbi:hypothetical protein [Kineococcus sp. NPDC059986]|uniref:hypothetical protein n=1 Tax=Kineococcus sp. NPDC059986 TaxID=3155538 RepID=UPI00344E1B62
MDAGWAPTPEDLADVAGEHVHRSRRRQPPPLLVAEAVAFVTLWAVAIALGDRSLLAVSLFCTVLQVAVVRPWRVRTWSTSIAPDGITLEPGRLHLDWDDVREVYVAGAWQQHSTVRTTRNQEFPLPGLDRRRAARLADLVRSHR